MRAGAERRVHRPRHHRIDAQRWTRFPFVGERRGQRRKRRLGCRVRTPERAWRDAARVQREDDDASAAAASSGSAGAREGDGRGHVDVEGGLPLLRRLMFEGAQRTEVRRRVDETVEAAELRAQCAGDRVVVGARRRRPDRAAGSSAADDLPPRFRRRGLRAFERRAREARPSRRAPRTRARADVRVRRTLRTRESRARSDPACIDAGIGERHGGRDDSRTVGVGVYPSRIASRLPRRPDGRYNFRFAVGV